MKEKIMNNAIATYFAIPALYMAVAIIFIFGAITNLILRPFTFIKLVNKSLNDFNNEFVEFMTKESEYKEKDSAREDWWNI